MVQHWSAERPAAAALLAPGFGPCSWRDLAHQLDDTANDLARLDLGAGHVVAVALADGPAFASAIISVGAAAACAPLNVDASVDELVATLRHLDADAIVVDASNGDVARRAADTAGVAVLELHAEDVAGRFRLTAERGAARAGAVDPDTALIVETSGTTGAPKLVARTHTQACASALHTADALGLGPDDRSLVVLPLCFGYGRDTALLAALINGGAAICTPGFDSRRFLESVEELEATWVAATPTMHHALSLVARAAPARAAASSIRLLRSGSAPLEPEVVDTIETAFDAPLLVAYASTEAGIIASERPDARKRGTVGPPAGAEIAIVGDTGEIAVRSPWADRSRMHDGWLHTGDLGHIDADGFLTITGRASEVINRGGEKVSPAEVESVLRAHASVADAVVFALPHRTLGEEVAALVVSASGATVDIEAVRRHACDRLTTSKVPRRIVQVDEIPRSAAGKVQRHGLAAALGLDDPDTELITAPSNEREAATARIWATVLGLERVSIDADFVDLGGDSLAAIEIMAMIDDEFGVRLPEDWLVQPDATVTRLAAAIDDTRRGSTEHVRSGPVLLRTGASDGRPFFFVPGVRGTALMLHRLARELTGERPFYGLRAPGLGDGERAPTRLTELAAHHVRHIRTIQPHGPYTVGGFSFGGFTAFEIACQLRDQGEEVDRVVIVDTLAPGCDPPVPFRRRVRKRLGRLRHGRAPLAPLQIASRRALRSYRPSPVPIPIVVLSTAQWRTRAKNDATLGWHTFATSTIETHSLPGKHRGVIAAAHVAELGVLLGSIIDEVRA